MVKRCTKCGEVKALEAFAADKGSLGGLRSQCRQCSKVYYEANKDTYAARQKVYYGANKETNAAWHKAYREANKEGIAARDKAYREANKEAIKEYYEAHKEAWAARHKETRNTNIAYLASIRPLECEVCGYDRCFSALDFHHTDPGQKEHNKDSMGRWIKRDPAYFKAKVDAHQFKILCANCHRELHASEKPTPIKGATNA